MFANVFVHPEVEVSSSTTTESTGLFSVLSKLSLNVKKEDKDADFYCEATYLLPGFSGMSETEHINITVFCKFQRGTLSV